MSDFGASPSVTDPDTPVAPLLTFGDCEACGTTDAACVASALMPGGVLSTELACCDACSHPQNASGAGASSPVGEGTAQGETP